DQIAEIHTRGHIELVKTACEKNNSALEMDTPISPLSYAAALKAAGAGIHAVESVMSGKIKRAFCAVRPPGHHAEKDRAMGFCLFNNIAIASKHALKNGAKKVAIVDWDVHHGNGTQHSFESDTGVLFASFHHWGIYPGTGHQSETGKGGAVGLTINYALPGGTGDGKYLSIMRDDLVPKLKGFKPDLVLISAGFDAHEADPLGGMGVTDEGFIEMTKLLMELADETCNGNIVSFLEGGYNLSTLGKTVALHVKTLMEAR
ncbi:MAG: histone deacetylase, partial [Nitrospinota bacterium]